jgi:hypothetical protein
MDVLGLFTQLLFRSVILILPLSVAWLAFRRLALSRSPNAWIYAGSGLIGAFTAAGLAPWALGGAHVSWIFYVLAAFSPALWLGVVMICRSSQMSEYEPSEETSDPQVAVFRPRPAPPPTLILENPEWPDMPTHLFRHQSPANSDARLGGGSLTKPASDDARSLLAVARNMRGNETSDRRRPKLLPPPEPEIDDLPFLRAQRTV